MRILILGGGRFQGRRAAEMLVDAGHSVTVLNRGTNPPPGARHVQGNVEEPETLAEAFRGQDYDAVIDNLAFDACHLERLMPRLTGRVGQYILISSLVVYDHERPHQYHLAGEAEADLTSQVGGEYHVGKRRCEQALQVLTATPWTVLRLAQIEGPGDPVNRRGFLIDRVADGAGLLIPSDHAHPYQPVWRDDAARAAVLAAGNHRAFGKAYNIAGIEVFSLSEWTHLLAEVVGVPAPFIVQLPLEQLRALAGFEYRLPIPYRPLLEIHAAQQDLDWQPHPALHWLPETVAWWRSSGLTSRLWEHRSREIAAIERVKTLWH